MALQIVREEAVAGGSAHHLPCRVFFRTRIIEFVSCAALLSLVGVVKFLGMSMCASLTFPSARQSLAGHDGQSASAAQLRRPATFEGRAEVGEETESAPRERCP